MLRILAVLILSIVISVFPVSVASSPPGFGSNLEQVVELAKKEGSARIAASLDRDEIGIVLEGFHKKYPEIKVEYTTSTGIDSGERILTEAISGHVEFDVVKVVYELQSKFVQAGVLAGPFEWGRFFSNTPKV